MLTELCTAIAISLGSHHLSHSHADTYQEFNPGISCETSNDISFGMFTNSLNKTSIHLGKIFNYNINPNITIGTRVGLTTGYNIPVTPYIIPHIQYQSIRVGYIPKTDYTEHVLTLEYIITF